MKVLLVKAAVSQAYEEELQLVFSFYGFDCNSVLFPTHLIHPNGQVTISDILSFSCNCTPGQVEQVTKLVKLLVVIPATNAKSEQSSSAVRHIKTYLCSTMLQQISISYAAACS